MNDAVTIWGLWSLAPLVVTLVLAFATRSALISMLIGTFVGTLMLGGVPGVTLNSLFQRSLGNENFIWIVLIVVLIGILFEGFKQSGVLARLAARFAARAGSDVVLPRRRVEVAAWSMGFVIVDDYFSPLLTGALLRPLADRAQVPREKLAFILDATTASVCILVPFTAWGAYMASLIAAQGGPVADVEQALAVFVSSIAYNYYPMLLLGFALLVCLAIVPDFGPMRAAEQRLSSTGELFRPGANPLLDTGLDMTPPTEAAAGSIAFELALPVAVVVTIGAGSLLATGSVKIVEAFLAGVLTQMLVLTAERKLTSAAGVSELIGRGAESVMPALLIVALAYALNAVAAELGVGQVIVGVFHGGLDADWLVPLTFLVTAAIAFATGTSWGAFALMMPVALPVAYSFAGSAESVLVAQTVAAIAGGGIFGDHASPVSDTTVLASLGAGSDHMDHVITQLPYALVVAVLSVLLYWLI